MDNIQGITKEGNVVPLNSAGVLYRHAEDDMNKAVVKSVQNHADKMTQVIKKTK